MRETETGARKKKNAPWIIAFTAVMLAFCLFMVWYVPASSAVGFSLRDVSASLETSRGRERKQQFEYDEVTEKLPKTRAELAETQPLADEAKAKVAALKDERRALREKKESLEALAKELEAGYAGVIDDTRRADETLPCGPDGGLSPGGAGEKAVIP